MTKRPFPIAEPAALRRADAALYCGVSAGHFDKLVREGTFPAPRDLSGCKVWLKPELDAALFAIEPETTSGGSTSCDVVFGTR